MPFSDAIDSGARAGNRRLVALLARSVHRGMLPPSLIFSGPAGAGKRQTAVATAQAINCLSPRGEGESHDACGTCAACMRIAQGMHPDVSSSSRATAARSRSSRYATSSRRAGYRPFEGRRRVVIINEADAMAASPQNALLKMLEEPPPFVGVHPGHGAAGHAAADRAVALSARAVSACPSRARSMPTRGRGAPRAGAGGGERRTASADRGGEGPAGQIPAAGGRQPRIARSSASHLHAMASLIRDVELLSSRAASDGLANPGRPARDRTAHEGLSGETRAERFESVDRALVALDSNASVKIVADWLVLKL